ncbi:MAG: cyclic nucleotide-binding domain-containing protein [Spirochaetota bacterium]
MSEYLKLYSRAADPAEAYLLTDGTVVFYISETDKYNLTGRNVVIGGTELILARELGIPAQRVETAVIPKGAAVKKISADNFISGLSNFSFLLNVAMVSAKQVVLSNQIISKNRQALKGKEEDRQKVCLDYYRITHDLKVENEKRRLPWLKEFVLKYETSLVYKEGEAVSRTAEPVIIEHASELADKMVKYPRGSVLCSEGEDGTDLFILQSGVIDVQVKGHSVAMISDPGTPIGEIALLIGEKRTATLCAKNNVVVTRIGKNDLRDIASRDLQIVKSIVYSLAKKHYQNGVKIAEINGQLVEKDISTNSEDKAKAARKYSQANTELSALKNSLGELVFKHTDPFLKEISARYL